MHPYTTAGTTSQARRSVGGCGRLCDPSAVRGSWKQAPGEHVHPCSRETPRMSRLWWARPRCGARAVCPRRLRLGSWSLSPEKHPSCRSCARERSRGESEGFLLVLSSAQPNTETMGRQLPGIRCSAIRCGVVMRVSIVNIFLVSDRPKPLWHSVVFIPHVDFSAVTVTFSWGPSWTLVPGIAIESHFAVGDMTSILAPMAVRDGTVPSTQVL